MKFPQCKENIANQPAGGLNGAAPNGSVADRSVLDITRSSRLFTPEIPAVETPISEHTLQLQAITCQLGLHRISGTFLLATHWKHPAI